RQDNESIYLMSSDDPLFWHEAIPIAKPTYAWEFIQIGNCSPPIELNEGWLVITHGVGALRRYCLGALLLDKTKPEKIIGRLKKPLLEPVGEENFGYVPNVRSEAIPIAKPTYAWEFIQIGNCSPPIELNEGWLVITHGVGALRRYCLGALLLDKTKPEKIIGRLKKPLLEPVGEENFGYVPNV